MAVVNVGPPSNVSTAGVEVKYKDGRTVRYWALSEKDRSKELREFKSRSKKKDSDIEYVKKCDRKKTI